MRTSKALHAPVVAADPPPTPLPSYTTVRTSYPGVCRFRADPGAPSILSGTAPLPMRSGVNDEGRAAKFDEGVDLEREVDLWQRGDYERFELGIGDVSGRDQEQFVGSARDNE